MDDSSKFNDLVILGGSDTNEVSNSAWQVSAESADELIKSAINKVSLDEPEFWSRGIEGVNDSGHGLFLYPAMMVPSVQRKLVEIISQFSDVEVAYDPFLGAGTSASACLYNGISSYGQDINPLAVLLSRARTTPLPGAERLVRRVVLQAKSDKSRAVTAKFSKRGKWFTNSASLYLSRLSRAIRKIKNISERRFLWVCLAETIRLSSNDRTSTYKLHARPLEEIASRKVDVIKVFEKTSIGNARRLNTFHEGVCKSGQIERSALSEFVTINHDDARCPKIPVEVGKFDFLITSPPYGDNITTVTYGQHSYLALHWIDWNDIDPNLDPDKFLGTTQQIDRISLGGKKPDDFEQAKDDLCAKSPTFKKQMLKLSKLERDGEQRVVAFFHDVLMVLNSSVPLLRKDAYLAFTVGNRTVRGLEIENTKIITELFANLGVVKVDEITRSIHNKRMPHRNSSAKTMSTECISIYRNAQNG